MKSSDEHSEAIRLLTAIAAIEAEDLFLDMAKADALSGIRFDLSRLDGLAQDIQATLSAAYPDMQFPPRSCWRGIEAGNIDRFGLLSDAKGFETEQMFFRAAADVAILCGVADCALPPDWIYNDPVTGEDLAALDAVSVATLTMFGAGSFSAAPMDPFRADAFALCRLEPAEIAAGFQLDVERHGAAISGLTLQFKRLGEMMALRPDLFEDGDDIRPGIVADNLRISGSAQVISATDLFEVLLDGLAPIWPGGAVRGEVALGDTWEYALGDQNAEEPRHISLQYPAGRITQNLIEPFGWVGYEMTRLQDLPGPSNLDHAVLLAASGVVEIDSRANCGTPSDHMDRAVALRVCAAALTKQLAVRVRQRLAVTEAELPLTCMLEAGTGPLSACHQRENPELPDRLAKFLNPGGVFWLPFGA